MSRLAKENGVLKLVRPGRYVETHTKPVTAAEVLKRFPRHSVTRPDFFEYPCVVVRPESVLNLGKVFFIVPNCTIYNLMKEYERQHKHSPRELSNSVNQQAARNQDCQRTINAGSTPKHLIRHRRNNNSSTAISCLIFSLHQDREFTTRKQHNVRSSPEIISKNKNTLIRIETKSWKDSRKKIVTWNHENVRKTGSDAMSKSLEANGNNFRFKHGKEANVLKSCLRKPDSARKLLKLQVSFGLPSESEEQGEE